MIVWGGGDGTHLFSSGGRYDPVSNKWEALSEIGAPTARAFHTAVWTGTRMIIWGGRTGDAYETGVSTGGVYDPARDAWFPTDLTNAPTPRFNHTAVCSENLMFVWGGQNSDVPLNSMGIYSIE